MPAWQGGAEGAQQHRGKCSMAQTLALPPACKQSALQWKSQGMLWWQSEKLFTKFKKWFITKNIRVFISNIYSSLHTRIKQDSGTTNQKAAITKIIHLI